MHIKVDKDLPRAAVRMLRDKGYQALSVVEQGMDGYKDPALWLAVQAEQRYLVTADKGFAEHRDDVAIYSRLFTKALTGSRLFASSKPTKERGQ